MAPVSIAKRPVGADCNCGRRIIQIRKSAYLGSCDKKVSGTFCEELALRVLRTKGTRHLLIAHCLTTSSVVAIVARRGRKQTSEPGRWLFVGGAGRSIATATFALCLIDQWRSVDGVADGISEPAQHREIGEQRCDGGEVHENHCGDGRQKEANQIEDKHSDKQQSRGEVQHTPLFLTARYRLGDFR